MKTYEVKRGYQESDKDTIVCEHVEITPARVLVFYADTDHREVIIAYNENKWEKVTRVS